MQNNQNIKLITIKDIVKRYSNTDEDGVFCYGGILNIRPPYQREYKYEGGREKALINSILAGFPINLLYWAENADGTLEVIDGQQRLLSICRFVNGDFTIDGKMFENLPSDEQEKFLGYSLMVYVLNGKPSEKLKWFKIINTPPTKLTDQELLNSAYTGDWLTDAKRFFSKTNCAAYRLGKDYVNGQPINQDYLETALKWISHGDIEGYMGQNQHNVDASELISYFKAVIKWVEKLFPEKNKLMLGLPWGIWYNQYKNEVFDPSELKTRIDELLDDDEIEKKKGIYEYVITGNIQALDFRAFSDKQRKELYKLQGKKCGANGCDFADLEKMHAHHKRHWEHGGRTEVGNGILLCQEHHTLIHKDD